LLSATPNTLPAPPLPPSEHKPPTEKNLTQLGEQHQITQLCERGNGTAQAAKQTKKSDVANQEVNQQINRAAIVWHRQQNHARSARQKTHQKNQYKTNPFGEIKI